MDNTVNATLKTEPPVPQQDRQYPAKELDLFQLLRECLRRWYLILLAAVFFGGAAFAYFTYMVKPTYESTAVLYIYSKETTLTSLTDLQIGSVLTEDYMVIVKSRPVMQQVVNNLNLPVTYKTLAGLIDMKNPEDTRVLRITATYTDPETAKKIADEVASVAAEYISDIMEMAPPKFIETGEVPTFKSAPATVTYSVLAAMLGVMLVCGILAVRLVLDDTVKSTEDVQKYLDLPVLASVARCAAVNDEKRARKAAKKRGGKK